MDAHEGCNLAGWLDVQRVAGNFHISVHAEEFLLLTKARAPGPTCAAAGLGVGLGSEPLRRASSPASAPGERVDGPYVLDSIRAQLPSFAAVAHPARESRPCPKLRHLGRQLAQQLPCQSTRSSCSTCPLAGIER